MCIFSPIGARALAGTVDIAGCLSRQTRWSRDPVADNPGKSIKKGQARFRDRLLDEFRFPPTRQLPDAYNLASDLQVASDGNGPKLATGHPRLVLVLLLAVLRPPGEYCGHSWKPGDINRF
jgi:hypothetical protein